MKSSKLKVLGVLGVVAVMTTACSGILKGDPDERWADYRNWTKTTEGRTGTGPLIGGDIHEGTNGYRDVYVNDIGKEVLTGPGPYVFPAGTIIVKEQFKSKADWEAQKKMNQTVSLKIADGTGVDNWIWAVGLSGKAGKSDFCAGCHTAALNDDYVFTTEAYLDNKYGN